MLPHTFVHIEGIGPASEARLWHNAVTTWAELLAAPGSIPRVSEREIRPILERSMRALEDDPRFFTARLKQRDCWRLFPHFRKQTAYLDIETTGAGPGCDITTIALYDGDRVRTYVNGVNMETFLDDIRAVRLLVTYNGGSFDIPVIERFFRTRLDLAHIDLRHVLAGLGISGGLKRCELQLGISRGCLDGVDGAGAVRLWREYERGGDPRFLDTLLAYNVEDTVNLERLMVEAYNRCVAATPFANSWFIDFPAPPQLVHQPDPAVVDAIKRLR